MTDGHDSPPPHPGDVATRGVRYAVKVRLDEKELPLKSFLHDMIGGAVTGLIAELRGVDEPHAIEIEVERV